MENHFNCIYMYVNKINGKKYIGQALDFHTRHINHLSAIRCGKQYPFYKAIRKHGIENFEIIILKENLETQCLLDLWECYYIDKYDTFIKNKKGYNVSTGGHNGNYWNGKTVEEQQVIKKKISDSKKGCAGFTGRHTEETKRKISEANMGKPGLKGSDNGNSKKVAQYGLHGNLIKVWEFMEYICQELGLCKPNICKCCKGERKTCGGYIWKYVEEREAI